MSAVAENWKLIFFAEGDEALEYIDLIDEEDEDALIDQIVNGKLDEIDAEDIPEPEDDDETYDNDEGYVLVYSRSLERVWIYELTDYDDGL